MMEQNLSDVMHGFLDAERRAAEAAAPDTTAETHALARRIGRRRAVRGAGIGIASVLVLGAVAVGVDALERPEPPLPAKPSPSVTVAPTPTPGPSTPAPTPTPPVEVPEAAPTAYLSDAVPMPAGTFARTDDSWRMLMFGDSTDQGVVAPRALYLVAPDATVYAVPAPLDLQTSSLLDWRPGTAEVLLSDFSAGGVHLVDLATGSTQLIATTMAFWNDPQFVPDGSGDVLRYDWDGARRTMARVDSDGSVIARTPEFAVADVPIVWHTSPDGTLLAVNDARGPALYSTDTLTPVASTSPYPARPDACRVWTWTSDDELLLQCSTAGATTLDPWEMRAEYWLVPTDGGAPTLMSGMPEAMRLGGAWRVDGRLVVSLSGVSEARASWWEWTEQGLTPLSSGDRNVVDVLGVEGSTIVFSEFSYQSGPQEPYQRVVALDPFTGERHILISTPPATLGAFGIAPQGQREASASQGGD